MRSIICGSICVIVDKAGEEFASKTFLRFSILSCGADLEGSLSENNELRISRRKDKWECFSHLRR